MVAALVEANYGRKGKAAALEETLEAGFNRSRGSDWSIWKKRGTIGASGRRRRGKGSYESSS